MNMSWTQDEIESLHSLLFSNDEKNTLLALELINSRDDKSPFIPAMMFMNAIEDEVPEVALLLTEICDKLPEQDKSYWHNKVIILSMLWYFGKKEFLKYLEEYKKEMPLFNSFMHRAPRYAYIYHSIGRRLIDFQKKMLGLEIMRKALDFDPDFSEVHFDYAFFLPEQKRYADEMVFHYERCIALGSESFEPYHNLGRVYALFKGMTDKGLEVFRAGLTKFPGTVDMLVEMAYILDEVGSYKEAKELLEQALASDDNYALAHNNLAFLYLRAFKNPEKAREHIDKALALVPQEGLYLHTLAEIEWLGYQNKDKALEALYKSKADKSYKGADKMIKQLENA